MNRRLKYANENMHEIIDSANKPLTVRYIEVVSNIHFVFLGK